MKLHEKYLDVLQNIEASIVETFRSNLTIHDYDVIGAIEAVIRYYRSQQINREPRAHSLSDNASSIFNNVREVCEWRLGRKKIETDQNKDLEIEAISIDEILTCLKKILNSAKGWNKRGGRRGYLEFISSFL